MVNAMGKALEFKVDHDEVLQAIQEKAFSAIKFDPEMSASLSQAFQTSLEEMRRVTQVSLYFGAKTFFKTPSRALTGRGGGNHRRDGVSGVMDRYGADGGICKRGGSTLDAFESFFFKKKTCLQRTPAVDEQTFLVDAQIQQRQDFLTKILVGKELFWW